MRASVSIVIDPLTMPIMGLRMRCRRPRPLSPQGAIRLRVQQSKSGLSALSQNKHPNTEAQLASPRIPPWSIQPLVPVLRCSTNCKPPFIRILQIEPNQLF